MWAGNDDMALPGFIKKIRRSRQEDWYVLQETAIFEKSTELKGLSAGKSEVRKQAE